MTIIFLKTVPKFLILKLSILLGITGYPDVLEPELLSALQNVSEVVCRFVDNNPSAWAPLICQVITFSIFLFLSAGTWTQVLLKRLVKFVCFIFQWSLNLLGQVVTKNNGRRGKFGLLSEIIRFFVDNRYQFSFCKI